MKIHDYLKKNRRMSLFDEMKLTLLTPSEIEEATFYASLKDQCLTKDSVMHSETDELKQAA